MWEDSDEYKLLVYSEMINWESDPDSNNMETEVQKFSPAMTKLVEAMFLHTILNEKTQNPKRKQLIPDTPHTKCPRFDAAIQSRLPKIVKDIDRDANTHIGCCNSADYHT